ncbi:MAG: hypothetical protein ABI321_21025 [Polyangia bacterium]
MPNTSNQPSSPKHSAGHPDAGTRESGTADRGRYRYVGERSRWGSLPCSTPNPAYHGFDAPAQPPTKKHL